MTSKTFNEPITEFKNLFWKKFVLGTIIWIVIFIASLWLVRNADFSDLISGVMVFVSGLCLYLWNFVLTCLSMFAAWRTSMSGWLKSAVFLVCIFDLVCLMLALMFVVHKMLIN